MLESFQLFLTKIYKNTMFQDGDKAWGTTEYWLRNTRSLEWFMGIRYKLALHRDEVFLSSASSPSSGRLKQFQTLNRAFAILEPLSKGVIPSRMWYAVNFLTGFMSPPGEVASKGQGLFHDIIGKMMGEIQKKCGQRAPGTVSPTTSGGLMGYKMEEARRSWTVCNDEIDRMDLDDDYDEQGHPGYDSDGVRKKGWFMDGSAGFQETGIRFLMEVLRRLFVDLMGSGSTSGSGSRLTMEAALLLEEDQGGFPICRDNWRPRGSLSRMSISSVSSHWQTSLLSPVSPAEGNSAEEMLETAIWLLSREEDAKAEGQLRALIDLVGQQLGGGKMATGLLPPSSPSRTLGLGGPAMEYSTSGTGPGLARARAFGKCAHYHLSRIYRRRGQREAASEHLRLAVEGSLLFDEFVGWEEVEFLFA